MGLCEAHRRGNCACHVHQRRVARGVAIGPRGVRSVRHAKRCHLAKWPLLGENAETGIPGAVLVGDARRAGGSRMRRMHAVGLEKVILERMRVGREEAGVWNSA